MTNDSGETRRSFLKKAGAGVAAASVAPMFVPSSAFGSNDRINVAIVGFRSRGGAHISGFGEMKDARIKTLVDVDRNIIPANVKEIQAKYGYAPGMESDMRRVFDDKEIDAVAFATPNHWHALGAIWAADAKKHVYVEKPASHTLWEGRQMVNAARKNNIIMQVGLQSRSRPDIQAAIKHLHAGGIGKIYMARGTCYKPRGNIGRYPDGPMKPGQKYSFTIENARNVDSEAGPYTAEYLKNVDYDLWMGPAPLKPFNPNRFHYNWHWQWDYGNGDTGNQGPHQLDIGRWGLGRDDYPVKIKSSGGIYVYESDQNTPNTQTTLFEYADGTLFEFGTRGLMTNADGKVTVGNIFYGSEGYMEIGGGGWRTFMGRKGEPGPDSTSIKGPAYNPLDLTGGGDDNGHFVNFVKAMRSGKHQDLACDIEEGHRSTALAHLANISYRTGRELSFDGKKERFVEDPGADQLLTREYRAPYVVPSISPAT